MKRLAASLFACAAFALPARSADIDVTLAVISSTQSMATYLAIDKGYFREADRKSTRLNSSHT